MTTIVVADTGPLIALARIGRLEVLRVLYDTVCVPFGVRDELQLDSNRPGAKVLSEAFAETWISAEGVSNSKQVGELIQLVDRGEAEAIVLVPEVNAKFLLIDDARGRRVASVRGIPVAGVAGVLLAAKSQGALSAVTPELKALAGVGYRLSERLIAGVSARAGE